ncbi:MAG: DUF6431 domain-containing protein [Treponema sp.]|jgi:hypothetical protein|nr:DUF6431 domain-containing protein [Treponema sp.]
MSSGGGIVSGINIGLQPCEARLFFYVESTEASVCPVCGGVLIRCGTRKRGIILANGKKIVLVIRRLYCEVCKRIHHELPDIIIPYKRHCAETIENIIIGGSENLPYEERTIQRVKSWWQVVGEYYLNILKAAYAKHHLPCPAAPAFKEMVWAAVNTNHWISEFEFRTRSACASG